MNSTRAVLLLVAVSLCLAVSIPDLSLAAKGQPTEKAARASDRAKDGQAAKKRSLSTIIKKSPREARPFPLSTFSFTGIPEPGPRW